MSSSELRAQAREALRGKWGKAVVLILSYLGIMIGISLLLAIIPLIGSIASFVISPVIVTQASFSNSFARSYSQRNPTTTVWELELISISLAFTSIVISPL